MATETALALDGAPAPSETSRTEARFLERVLALLGALFVAAAVVVPLARLTYPYELQPLEGALVDQARHGWLTYRAPSIRGTAFIYAPLHQWLLRLSQFVVGGYWPGRLLSLIGSIAAIAAIAALVRHETGDRTAAFAAAGLFAASVRLSAGWFDLVRVDGIAMGLAFTALWRLRTTTTARHARLAAFLLVLTCLGRQNFVPFAIAIIAATAVWDRAVARAAAAAFAAIAAPIILVLQLTSHGWVWFYTVTLPSQHPTLAAPRLGYWIDDLFAPMPFACALSALWFVRNWRGSQRRAAQFWTVALGTLLATAWLARIHAGGYFNVLLPAYGALAIGFGLAIGTRRQFARSAALTSGVLLLAIAQLAMLAYDPRQLLPTAADRAAAQAVIGAIRSIPGEVWVPGHPDYAHRAGKATFAHYVSLADVLRGHASATRRALRREIDAAVDGRRFAAIVVTGPEELIVMPGDFRDRYKLGRPLSALPAVWGNDPQPCSVCGIWLPR
jgi:hypothetical protein